MDATDRGNRDFSDIYFCGLEWVTWALDAAREFIDQRDANDWSLGHDHYYADELLVS